MGLGELARRIHFAYPTRRSTSLLVRRRVWVSSPQANYPVDAYCAFLIFALLFHNVIHYITQHMFCQVKAFIFSNSFFVENQA
jgi:hypothetical protein